MKDEKQLVLFFRRGQEIDGASLAAHLSEKFKVLKDPIVIPFNPKNREQPLIIFNQGTLKLNVTVTDVSFICNRDDYSKLYDTIIEIVEYLEELDYSFERMGYIATFLHSKKDKEKFIEKVFKDKDLIDNEFQLSWYKKELIDSVSVNVWQRNMTDMMNKVDFVTVFDINTPIDEVYNITSSFLDEFLKKCDKYMSEKDKELK